MKKVFNLIYFVLIIFFTTSCQTINHSYYLQNAQQVNLFKKKNELALDINTSNGNFSKGINASGAFSLSNNLISTLGYQSYWNNKTNTINGVNSGKYKCSSIEGGLGVYKNLGKKGVFELIGSYGFGAQNHDYSLSGIHTDTIYFLGPTYVSTPYYIYNGNSKIISNKLCLTPVYGFAFRNFEIAVSSKISYFGFRIKSYSDFLATNYKNDLNSLNKTYLLFEPAISAKFGIKNIKLQIQCSNTNVINSGAFKKDNYCISLGLNLKVDFDNQLKVFNKE